MLGLSYPENISNLLFRGFLIADVHIGDHLVVFKTVNENESAEIERLSRISDEEIREAEGEEQAFLAARRLPWLLAFSTFMIDDHCVLPDRGKNGWYRPLVDFYKTRHPRLLASLADLAAKLASWYAYETANIERFTAEPLTRSMWFSYKNTALNSPSVTCLEGTQYLGLNQHQVLFKSFLSQWERKKDFEQQWELTKAVVAAHNSKMYQGIERNDKTRRQTEEQREQELLEGRAVSMDREDVYAEMEEELVRQVTGQKDHFDHMVDAQEFHEKWDLLLDRLDPFMYTLMYGRKIQHEDMVVVGRRRRDDLPMGEYDLDEARQGLRKMVEDINVYGKFLQQIDPLTEDEEEAVIGVAALVATSWYEEFQKTKKVTDDRSAESIRIP